MGSMYKSFETDPTMEKQGIWLDYSSFRLRIARAGGSNKKFQKLMETRTRPHRIAIKAETFENEQALEILKGIYADAIVLDWEVKVQPEQVEGQPPVTPVWQRGIEAKDGSLLPVNKETIIATFTNLPDLFTDVQEQAATAALFRTQLLEDAGKNS